MVDYIKVLLQNIKIDRLLSLDDLEFRTVVSQKTGELSGKMEAKYHYCKIIIHESGIVLFSGSIHKLYNSMNGIKAPNHSETGPDKGFNGNQLTINQIFELRQHLCELFDCEPTQMILQNIELGVNTSPKFDPKLYVKGLLYHKNKMFEFRFNNNFAQACHCRYFVKIYNKSYQYGMNEYTLRIELKIMKSEDLKQLTIRTLSDINEETLEKAKNLLLDQFDKIVHYDYSINKKNLSNKQKERLKDYMNPRYWVYSLRPNHRYRHVKALLEITEGHSENLHMQLRREIVEKCVTINRLSEKGNCVMVNPSSIGLSKIQNTINYCLVTGIPLTHEKVGAKYIKTTTLSYLKQNETETYIGLCSLLLNNTKGGRPAYENSEIVHLAKQVRNRFYNKNGIRQTGYNKKIYHNQQSLNLV